MTDSSTKGSKDGAEPTKKATSVVLAIIGVIVVGTLGWYLLTILGAKRVGPEKAKHLAEAFERECFLDIQDQTRCRELIGTHHRDCLMANIERVSDDAGTSRVEHDREGYLSCMREKTGVGKSTSSLSSDNQSE